jgi:hypothetical protein
MNSILLLDKNDNPLVNAAVYLYQCVNTGYLWASWNKYYPDRPKFAGNTDASGVYVVPLTTAPTWDDWETDAVEKAVMCRSLFDRRYGPSGPNWQVGEMILLKIVGANGEVEFQVLPFTEVNAAFFENVLNGGSSNTPAQYKIRTSLTSAASPVDIVLPAIPPEIQTTNLRPVANIVGNDWNISVPAYQYFTLDATASYDPEGQPLYYWWGTPSKWTMDPVVTERAGGPGEEYECLLFVSDGLRYSDQITIRVTTY